MVTRKKDDQKVEEQKWEDPLDPEKPGDDRDQEQLLRQYKEAKRLNENLTDKDTKKKQLKFNPTIP
jgi:hypothetical protein